MSLDKYHLSKDDGKWKLKKEGAQRASKTFEGPKEEAIRKSADHIKGGSGGSLKIHKEDGKIQEERTYPRSKGPKNSPG